MRRIHATTLHLGHHLQHTHDETDNREATDATIDRFVETPHEEEVLDERDQDRHGCILFLPFQEGLDSLQPGGVFERYIHLQASPSIDVFDQWHLGMEDELELVQVRQIPLLQERSELEQGALSTMLRPATLQIRIRTENEIHVSGGQVEPGRE